MRMTRAMLAFAAGVLVFTGQAQASMLTIDTNPGWDGSINSGWAGSGQSLTIQSGFETFDDIGFYFDEDSWGRTFDFFLTGAPLNGGPVLYSTSFVVTSGINVISIGQTLTAGQTVHALLDYNSFVGATAHFSYVDSYAGGNSSFGPVGGQVDYLTLDHRFIANFSGDVTSTPEPTTMALLGLTGLGGIGLRLRRNRKAQDAQAAA